MLNFKPTPAFDYDNLSAHELADLLPMIDGANFENLKADIAKNGILEPILLFEGRILDGRNRYRAAKAIGALGPGDFTTFEGTYAEAEAYVFSTNFLRREMTNAQKHRSTPTTAIARSPDVAASPPTLALALLGKRCLHQVPIKRSSLTSVRLGMRCQKLDGKSSLDCSRLTFANCWRARDEWNFCPAK